MEFKGTPAPWFIHRDVSTAIDSTSKHIAMVNLSKHGRYNDVYGEEHEANAHLIAAAPELLEALIELVQSYDKCSIDHNGLCQEHFLQEANDCTFKKANLAIAKALGQQ
ncbi:hypothetical protein [Providencia rettgeri]|uniref:hypothetical protein n=1 Tax=Providencia rettgeri TaxID=587 RepID=UPI001182C916|nr:hypothetical protein [Providencia rettgeri]